MDSRPYSIKLLGQAQVLAAVSAELAQTGTRSTLLLARLAMAPERGHDRKRLTELLWPDRSEQQAQASLRQTLWTLRKTLGDEDQRLIRAD